MRNKTDAELKRSQNYFNVKQEWVFMYKKSQSQFYSAKILSMGLKSKEFLKSIDSDWKLCYRDQSYLQNNCSSNVRLLYAYSIETMLKTLNILKHGDFKATHDCLLLASNIKPIKFSKQENKILRILEHEVLWASRYPNPKKIEDHIKYSDQSLELSRDKESNLSEENLEALWNKLNKWIEHEAFRGPYLSRIPKTSSNELNQPAPKINIFKDLYGKIYSFSINTSSKIIRVLRKYLRLNRK
jgi:hypothetical protein